MSQLNPDATRKTLSIYWQHAKAYPRQLAGVFIIMPILQLADDFITPLLTSQILNRIATSDGPLDLKSFIQPVAIILAVELGVNLFWRPYIKIVWSFEENVMRDLLNTSFKHLMRMSYKFYSNRFAGSLVSQANKFSGSFERLADTMLWSIYKLIIAFIFTIVILIRPAPISVLVLVLFSTIYVAILIKVKKTERPFNEKWAVAESARTGQLADAIGNIMAVKSFAHEKLEGTLFGKKAQAVHDRSIETMHKVMHNEAFTTTSQRAINAAAILSAILLGARLNIALGTIYLVLIYTMSIIRRLWDLNNTLRNFNRVFGDAREMTEILGIQPEIADTKNPEDLKMNRGKVVFKDVTFGHDSEKPLFKHLNLRIQSGEKIGLVGPSGGGKTTLTTLLLRFMDIQGGTISVDGQNITNVTQNDLRSRIAYVPQEPLLFHRTLRDNIRYGQLDASDETVEAVSKMANAHEFIETLNDGYETMVGERGTKLSGGQRQRVAIARAMIKNAPILVLDEATSALDSESEELIQDALWRLMEGRTAIVIAHRLSTIQKMDRILVLKNGRIVEEGSHKDLVRLGGVYANLWNRQSGGFIEE
jgi:ATP-binding cassette subfamily B protein